MSGAGDRVPLVDVCIDGHGPFPFVVSSGAGVSVVAPHLARALRLPPVAPAVPVLGVTCVTSAREVLVRRWSMGGLGLATQGVLVAGVPDEHLRPRPAGVIGSDVLARFQAVRIDVGSGRMRLLDAETSPPATTAYVVGQADRAPPPTLLKGRPAISVALTELAGPTGTTLSAPVSLGAAGGAPASFAVDTGAATSSVVPSAATGAHLRAAAGRAPASGDGCQGREPTVRSGAWHLGGAALRGAPLSLVTIAGGVNQALDGVLGADVLARHGVYVIDYEIAHLWVGGRP